MTARLIAPFLFLVLCCMVCGCGQSDPHDHSHHHHHGHEQQGQGQPKVGPKGDNHLHVFAETLAETPKVGKHTVAIKVFDHDGNPIESATIKLKAHMPQHGHGSASPTKIEELGEGKYQAKDVHFHMPGRWELIIDVEAKAEKLKEQAKHQVEIK